MNKQKSASFFELISESIDKKTSLKYENKIFSIVASISALVGSVTSFLSRYYILHENIKNIINGSFMLFAFGILFMAFSQMKNELIKMYIYSILVSAVLVFVFIDFYDIIGPALLTISFCFVITIMIYSRIEMLIIFSTTNIILNIFNWNNLIEFNNLSGFYYANCIMLVMLSISTIIVFKVFKSRQEKIILQYNKIRLSEKKNEHIAYHDTLTGLPNRLFLSEQLNHAISLASRMGNMIATMFLDLDDFKMINDTMGHDIGDQLLVEVSKRLVNTLRKCDTVARIGGDEFIMVIENVENMDYINIVSEKIIQCFNDPFRFNNHECFITTSLGVAIYPNDGVNAEELIKNADIAMYMAKRKDKNQYVICTPVMKTKIVEVMEMSNSLSQALKRNEFELYYQPQLSCTSNEIVGLEALIRWHHPELGMVPPLEFIPIAEQTNLIIPIGEWVLRTACKQNKAWQDAGLPQIRMGVNLSVKQFQNGNLASDVENILKETGLDYKYLELEITESAVMKGKGNIIETLNIFKNMGIHIAIDDFGTEYSSLSYLKQLPADRIKIPMTFIKGIGLNTKDEAITKAIIILAKNMGLSVIAEGVERKNQLDFLNQGMCDEIQGYYYYKPMPVNEVEELLRKSLI
jgi:diguanylate cyclase (GGDEF)-like protein